MRVSRFQRHSVFSPGVHEVPAPYVIHEFLKAFRISHLHSAILPSPSIKGLHANILFTTNLFNGLASVSLANDSDELFGLRSLLFHVLV
jgi:hypothetical protein